ncbi:hypothetical protein [Streptomyces tauricus]|uniref:hypothetical protein n=1 Tax=Streptomyces tauricus TaxID=68274 RepID=UPI003414E70A
MAEPTDQSARPDSPAQQPSGFRIIRSTEIAPGWWGQPTEVGETGSATVATTFCDTQNKVTMDPNRSKRIEFSAVPIAALEEAVELTRRAALLYASAANTAEQSGDEARARTYWQRARQNLATVQPTRAVTA